METDHPVEPQPDEGTYDPEMTEPDEANAPDETEVDHETVIPDREDG